jgi:hypothetical protein
MKYKSNLPFKSNKQFNPRETPSNGPQTGHLNASFIFNSDLSQIGENSNRKNDSKKKETFNKNASKFLVNDDAKSINLTGNGFGDLGEDKSNLGDASFMSAVCGHAFEGLLRLNNNQDSISKSCLMKERADLESMGESSGIDDPLNQGFIGRNGTMGEGNEFSRVFSKNNSFLQKETTEGNVSSNNHNQGNGGFNAARGRGFVGDTSFRGDRTSEGFALVLNCSFLNDSSKVNGSSMRKNTVSNRKKN